MAPSRAEYLSRRILSRRDSAASAALQRMQAINRTSLIQQNVIARQATCKPTYLIVTPCVMASFASFGCFYSLLCTLLCQGMLAARCMFGLGDWRWLE